MTVTDAVDLLLAFDLVGARQEDRDDIARALGPLQMKPAGLPHYEHSLRVGLLARQIAEHVGLDQRALLFAGLLHDTGKALVPVATLGRTVNWTLEDSCQMRRHVEDGHRLLQGRFDFTAEVIARHHAYQRQPYPDVPIAVLHEYSDDTRRTIETYAHLLAIADTFDAFHRVNSATGGRALRAEEIRERMLAAHPGVEQLVRDLYDAGVLN